MTDDVNVEQRPQPFLGRGAFLTGKAENGVDARLVERVALIARNRRRLARAAPVRGRAHMIGHCSTRSWMRMSLTLPLPSAACVRIIISSLTRKIAADPFRSSGRS